MYESPVYDDPDEISLRELYLTLRRGLPLVIVVTLVAAALGFLFASLGGKRYMASAVVQVTPLAFRSEAPGALDLSNATTITFEAYQAQAFSPTALAAAATAYGADAPDIDTLRRVLRLERLSGANSETLTVRHEVLDPNAATAAEVANAWAEATRDAAESTVANALANVAAGVDAQQEAAKTALDEAEAAWEGFQRDDARTDLRTRLLSIGTRDSESRQRLDELARLSATASAEQELLAAIVSSADTGNPADLTTLLQALEANGALDPAIHDDLVQGLSSIGLSDASAGVSLTYAIAQTRLQQQTTALAGYVAERAAIESQLAEQEATSTELRTQLAQLERTASELQRSLTTAQAAFDSVAALGPQVTTITKLSAAAAHVLDEAVPPSRPQPRGRITATIAAAAAGLVLAVFLVFLRAAIAEPTAGGSSTGRRATRPIAAPADAEPRRSSP